MKQERPVGRIFLLTGFIYRNIIDATKTFQEALAKAGREVREMCSDAYRSLMDSLSRGERTAVSELSTYLVELVAKMREGLGFDVSLDNLRLSPVWKKAIISSVDGVNEFRQRLIEQKGEG